MNVVLALLPQIMAAYPTIKTGAVEFVAWVKKIRSAAQQSGEWTDELENQFEAALGARANDPAYQQRARR